MNAPTAITRVTDISRAAADAGLAMARANALISASGAKPQSIDFMDPDPFDPFTTRYRIHDTAFNNTPPREKPEPMDETQPKSEAPRLTEIAASILTGLLASGHYTIEGDKYKETRSQMRSRYKPEAVNDAIELTAQIVEQTKKQFGLHTSE